VRAGVPHGFSTRIGGVSGGVFASLNLGNPSDLPPEERDPPGNIRENWARILAAAGCAGRELVEVHQVHGAEVRVCRRGGAAHAGARDTKADALVSDDPGRALGIRVADCAPVLVAAGDGGVVGVAHAGWRGVIGGVVVNTVERLAGMGATGLIAAIGPCIGAGHFEVGDEVAAEFERVFGARAPVAPAGKGKALVDLKAAIRMQLEGAGVARVDVSDRCTFRDAAEFYSHRREKGVTGRSGAVIGARE